MELETRLGTIEVNEDEIIDFPVGILGFSEYHRYVIMNRKEALLVFSSP